MQNNERLGNIVLPDPFKSSLLLKQKFLKHGFFSRQGGVSQGLLTSLNTRDNGSDQKENLQENYNRISAWFGYSSHHLALIRQVHGKTVLWVDKPLSVSQPVEADALVTRQPHLILCIRTADCVPILLYDPVSHLCAAIHAGWKGALLNIARETVKVMEEHGSDPQNILAAMGPCIHQKSYEVGEEVHLSFKDTNPVWTIFFKPSANNNHYWLDLPGLVTHQLHTAGLREIDCLEVDTYVEEKAFFSCRRSHHRQEAIFGNQISAISLTDFSERQKIRTEPPKP